MNKNNLMPLLLALCVVIGILIGTFYANHFSGNRLNIINSGSNRLNNLLHIVDDQYVDSVNIDDLVEKAMPQILSELDPHSVYISAKDVQRANDDLKGSFSGVGIEFVIRKDTLHVQNVLSGGPAEKAGLLAGDKIVSIDGKPFTGKEATNEEAMHRLKGKRGTTVSVGVLRYKEKKVRYYTITRDNIITHSVTATYMLDEKTGYIRIKNFGDRTYHEMLAALTQLTMSSLNFSQLVIDLRDNTGGYLQAATMMVNEFLPKNRLIVYTQGRKSPRADYRSDGRGSYQEISNTGQRPRHHHWPTLVRQGSCAAADRLPRRLHDSPDGGPLLHSLGPMHTEALHHGRRGRLPARPCGALQARRVLL